jgi:predicted ATPase
VRALVSELLRGGPRRSPAAAAAVPVRRRCFVLTGGPGGGKSTLIAELRAADRSAQRWLLVPEAAPLLFQAGLDAREQRFQVATAGLQVALETACAQAARPGQVLICHRGALDTLAYWRRNGWPEADFFALTGTSREDYLARYQGVIHLQTTAIGAAAHYRRWPETHRPETPAQAAEIDHLCAQAWQSHPGYMLIANEGRSWPAKARAARDLLDSWLTAEREGTGR